MAPTVADEAETFVFGDLHSLRQLPLRYRELIISAIIAAGGSLQDGGVEYLKVALEHGAAKEEVDEMFAMLAAYAYLPKALAAARAYKQSMSNAER